MQGLTADLVAALILLLLPIVTAATGWGDFEWQVLGFLVAKTGVVTLFSYVMRTWLDRSALPTPLPPSDPGEPDQNVGRDELGTTSVLVALAYVALGALASVLLFAVLAIAGQLT